VSPRNHGIIDYAFSGLQMGLPWILGLNKKTAGTYSLLGAGVLAINALTNTPVGMKKKMSMTTHKKVDIGLLAGLGLLTAVPYILKEKKSRIFHLVVLGGALASFLLTDYEAAD
jgi:hypothetical protein